MFKNIVVKAGDFRIPMDVETARKLMMKLEEVLRVEHATVDNDTPQNLNDWVYFPQGENIVVSLVYVPLVVERKEKPMAIYVPDKGEIDERYVKK